MIKRILIIASMICIVIYGTVFGMEDIQEYELDKSHSSISFKISHMVVSKVRGQFTDFSIQISENTKDLKKSFVEAVIKTKSINTNNEKRDNHLRSQDFFYVEKFPEIIFKSKRLEKKDDMNIVVGTLTMNGISKEISIPFELSEKIKDPWGNTRVGIEASAKLDRKDFGLKWNKTLDKGGLLVGNEVKIEILLELISKKKETKGE